MKLKGKFILAIVAVLGLSFGMLMLYTSSLQNKLVIGQAQKQARALHRQIVLTRQWVADHQGVYFLQTDHARPNPFLEDPTVTTGNGMTLVRRNPAMVTRELSEYAAREGLSWFRVTSLRPINPNNQPDIFERASLNVFHTGATEKMTITKGDSGKILRLAVPLVVKKSCLNCHEEHGYKVGDIRGALSISVPIAWADSYITDNNKSIVLYGLLSILLVVGVVYFLFDNLVSSPLKKLTEAMENFPDQPHTLPPRTREDEIGKLEASFTLLCERLATSINALQTASEKGFRAEKLAALGQLTAGIAHEVNNPLGGMLNCVKTMQNEPENIDLQKRYLPLLEKGLRRIEHTMNQLLNYGRVNPLKIHKVEINNVIHDCLELLEYRLNTITVNLDLCLKGPHCVDIEAVKQIVMNILLNAIQAMPSGGSLTISSFTKHNVAFLIVKDTGIGIAKNKTGKIFDPFYTTKEVGEGTGLGLAVTLSLVQRLDGNIEVQSEPGKGSTFTVSWPINLQCLAD